MKVRVWKGEGEKKKKEEEKEAPCTQEPPSRQGSSEFDN